MEAFSLFELNEHIRRVIALNFQEYVWVRCEIAQVKKSRGHYYLDLVEKVPQQDEILAQMSAVIWAKTAWLIERKLKDIFEQLLQNGMEACLKVRVDFHERYGMKLIVEDIDPAYTLGHIEIRRREIIETLKAQGLLEKNGLLPLPITIQRIAVLSAVQAAGYQDFTNHLLQHTGRFKYWIDLYPIAMQGMMVESELIKALQKIQNAQKHYDCVVIIRGGGSRMDLSAFDSLEIGKAIAAFPLPVFTGIGHDIDNTVTDSVAHTSLKTPTAVADFLSERNSHFANTINQVFIEITQHAKRTLQSYRIELKHLGQLLQHAPREFLMRKKLLLDQIPAAMQHTGKITVKNQRQQLLHCETLIHSLDPAAVLQRGFSITTHHGARIRSTDQVHDGDEIITYLHHGRLHSKITRHEQDT